MADFEDPTETDSEIHLRETPDAKVRNHISRMREPHSSVSFGGLQQVVPPSRDGKVRKPETGNSKAKRFQTFILILVSAFGVILLINYRYVGGMAYLALATFEMLNRNLDGAATHYRDAYYINPEDTNSLFFAASIHLGQKKEKLAQEEFAEGFKTTKIPAQMYNQRAKILNGMGRTEEALADWNEAIKLKPKYFAAHAQRALIYMHRREYAKAIPDWDIVDETDPDPHGTEGLSQKSYCLSELRRFPEALAAVNKGLEKDPKSSYLNDQHRYIQSQLGITPTH